MKFEKPPLVELVAEFRWYPTDLRGELLTNPYQWSVTSNEVELFYSNFRESVTARGFNTSERLIAEGFPHPMHQPVIRYRHRDSHVVLQIGVGLMSVHALPPYESWETFRPEIKGALSSLIATRKLTVDDRKAQLPTPVVDTEEKDFIAISLRYIDAFRPEVTGNRTGRQFLEEVLGFKIELPEPMSDQAKDPGAVEFALQVKTPLKAGGALHLSLGRNPNDPESIVMDTVVVCEDPIRWNLEGPMESLEVAHGVIHHLFVGMTKPIHANMNPLSEETKTL